jgi:hypothetical protein
MTVTSAAASADLHPWNARFDWPGTTGTPLVASPDQAEAYDRDGYFLLRDARS